MKLPLNFGGGGGSGSDDCTAVASDVIETKTAIYNGSDDEPEYGTMKEYSDTTKSANASDDTSASRLVMAVPAEGRYDIKSKLYDTYSDVVKAIGLSDSKIAVGNTILGVAGSYTGLGNATTGQVLSGKTFSSATLSNASGTMANVAATETAKNVTYSSGNVLCDITNGAHITDATSGYPEVSMSQSTLASAIGLTADKLVVNNSILGVTGTAVSAKAGTASYTSSDLYYCGQQFNPLVVSSSTTFNYTQYGSGAIGPGYIAITINGTSSSTRGSYAFGFSSQVDLSQYSVCHMRLLPVSYQGTYSSGSESYYWDSVPIYFVHSTAAPGTTGTSPSTVTYTYTPSSSNFTVNECTWTISSITSTRYVGFRIMNNSATNSRIKSFIIDRIWFT